MDDFIKALEQTNFKLLSLNHPGQTMIDATDVNELFEKLGYEPFVKNHDHQKDESGSNMVLVTLYMNLMLTKRVESLEKQLSDRIETLEKEA